MYVSYMIKFILYVDIYQQLMKKEAHFRVLIIPPFFFLSPSLQVVVPACTSLMFRVSFLFLQLCVR